MQLEIITKNTQETKKAAATVAKFLSETPLKYPPVLALEGSLGAGKTTFVQGLARALKIKEEEVLSPTFLIIKKIELQNGKLKNFYHIDTYRLKNSEELAELGFDEIIKDKNNLTVIEWADKIKDLLPEKIIHIKFSLMPSSKNERKILLSIPEK